MGAPGQVTLPLPLCTSPCLCRPPIQDGGVGPGRRQEVR